MIVSVTRGDLREEFDMADEAFALSPISARAAQPSEEDYDAISEAFMETSRGRWFLGEYAKRNRNADTRMVLDAVARIEQTLAAQKQPEPPDNGLAEALTAIRGAVERGESRGFRRARRSRAGAALAPIRKGARMIREISWRWREIGADGRICDLIDSQVSAIEASCGQISSSDPRAALSAAFDLISQELDKFGDREAAAQAWRRRRQPAALRRRRRSACRCGYRAACESHRMMPKPRSRFPRYRPMRSWPSRSRPRIRTEAADAHDEAGWT